MCAGGSWQIAASRQARRLRSLHPRRSPAAGPPRRRPRAEV